MNLLTRDYLELKQVKIFLDKNTSISESDIEKSNVGQLLLNNKYFKDFDGDGQITYNDYKIAWDWIMQGKPTDVSTDESNTHELPYERVQHTDINILSDQSNVNRIGSLSQTTSVTKKKFKIKEKIDNNEEVDEYEPSVTIYETDNKNTTNKVNTPTYKIQSMEVDNLQSVNEANLNINATDYAELMDVKKYLNNHINGITAADVSQDKEGQSLLNNKFFDDFDGDGKVTINDFNIGWNWLMQGKPTSLTDFKRNFPEQTSDIDIPYQRIQDTEENILPFQSDTKFRNNVNLLKTEKSNDIRKVMFVEKSDDTTIDIQPSIDESVKNKFKYDYFTSSGNSRRISSYDVSPVSVDKKNLNVSSIDYMELQEVREFISKHKSISVDQISKLDVNQSLLNNKFFNDFDMDGTISFDDFNIAWNWVMQGKPTDIVTFAKNKSATPDTHKIPYQVVQDTEINILQDNRVIVYDRNEEEPEFRNLISEMGMTTTSGLEVISTGTEEESSDFNEDGEIDEIDLQILDCYIMSRPSDICEYNRDRGECPEATKLPSMLTAKFACDTSYYYGDVHLSGDDIIQNKDVEYYMDWLLGNVETPGMNTLKFILSNNWIETPYKGPNFREVLRDCNIRDGKTDMTLHSTSIYRIDYRDYLIMKEWLRLGKPNMKGKISEYDSLTWFNANSQEGTPIACKLPFEPYMDIGSSCYTFDGATAFEEYL